MGGRHETAPTIVEGACAPRLPTHSRARPRRQGSVGDKRCQPVPPFVLTCTTMAARLATQSGCTSM